METMKMGIAIVLLLCCCSACTRTKEFRAQAELGQPIVKAIEAYHAETGNYPASLSVLVPKYLPSMPDIADVEKRKYEGWEYRLLTEQQKIDWGKPVPYTLRYDMGLGGVEYEPPNWLGNDEGNRTVVLTNR